MYGAVTVVDVCVCVACKKGIDWFCVQQLKMLYASWGRLIVVCTNRMCVTSVFIWTAQLFRLPYSTGTLPGQTSWGTCCLRHPPHTRLPDYGYVCSAPLLVAAVAAE